MQHSSLPRCCRFHIWRPNSRCRLKRLYALLVPLSLFFALPVPVSAQFSPDRQWSVFHRHDGLISNDVYTVLADEDAIWVGTSDGVSRFDGKWRSFPSIGEGSVPTSLDFSVPPGTVSALARVTDPPGILAATDRGYVARWDGQDWTLVAALESPIYALAAVKDTLWIATEGGLQVMRGKTAEPIPELVGNPVYALAVDAEVVWAGTRHGLFRLPLDASSAEPIQPVNQPQLIEEPVRAVWTDGAGDLWFGAGRKLVHYAPETGSYRVTYPFDPDTHDLDITSIAGLPGDSLWIASTDTGVVQYLFDRGEQVGSRILGSSASGGLDSDIIRQMTVDRDGTFWFATPVGLFRYRNWAWIRTDDRSDGLNVTDLLVDRQGALWVATGEEGVLRKSSVYAQGVTYLPGETALPSEQVNRLEEDPTGGIWVATDMGVARSVEGKWDRPVANVDLPSSVVRSLKSDAHGLWIGTAAGLARYTFANHVVDEIPQLHGHQIDHLAYDMLGNLWVTGSHGEIWQYQGNDIWLDLAATGRGMPGGATVTALLPDAKSAGGMLAAFSGEGILRWNGQEWVRLSKSPRVIDERVFALMVDRADGSLWIGSETGLSREDDLSWTAYDGTDGIQNGAIHTIVSDPRGGYWFGGQKGLSYYRAEHTQPWIALVEPVSAGAALQAYIGRPIAFRVDVGDIQTPREKLQHFYREIGPAGVGDWTELAAGSFSRKFPQTGDYQVEFMVRDQAFNYSKLLAQHLDVAPLPSMIALPFVGDIDVRVGSLLAVFGGFAFIGLGYVGFEVVARRIRAMAMVRRGFNPYISGEPVRQENMFFGREDMLQRIVATLHNNSIMIHGERRIGKTTLLYQLANVLRHVDDHEYWFLPVFIDLEGTTGARLFHLLIEDIAQEILALPNLVAADQDRGQAILQQSLLQVNYTDREFARDLRTVIRILEQYSTDRKDGRHARLILLMDEMDTLSKFDHLYQQQLRRIFMRDFAATVGAVVAGIEISKDWDRVESPWYNLFNEIAMQPFTSDQAVELLTKPVRGCYVFAPDALEFIIAQCEGRPYRLQQYALQAVNHMIKHRRRRITLIDALAAHAEIQAVSDATDARAGLSNEGPVQNPIKEYTERMLSPT